MVKAALFALLLFLSLWRLPDSPATWFDEGINVGIAKSLVQHGVYSLQTAPGVFVAERPYLITTNYPVLLPVALSLKLFGINFVAARLPAVVYLLGFVVLVYLLMKRWHGETSALWAAALLITFVPLYGNGKDVLGEVPGMMWFLAGLLALPDTRDKKRLFVAGALFGLAAATKPFFLLVLAAVLIGECGGFKKRQREVWSRLLLLFLGMLAPMAIWLGTILSPFSFSTLAHTVAYYSNSYAANDFMSLLARNSLRFFTETTPIHFLLLFSAIMVGFVTIKRRGGAWRAGEIILMLFVGINVLWYLKTPGWYRYFFPSHLVLLMLFPAALLKLIPRKIAIGILILLFSVQFVYLLTKRHDPLYLSSGAARAVAYINQQAPKESAVFAINTPSVAFLLNADRAWQYLQINPVLHFGQASLQQADGSLFPYVVTNGSTEGVTIPDLSELLQAKYSVAWQGEHYIVYHRL